jgi:hypothetical protein
VVALSVRKDDGVWVLLTVPEDDEVGGVEDLNRPCASRFCVAALWPLRPPPPPACKPSVRPRCLPPPFTWIPSMRPRLSRRPLGYVAALRPLHSHPPLAWEGPMRPLWRCNRSPQGKPRCGASRCGGVGPSRRGVWSGAEVYWGWGT